MIKNYEIQLLKKNQLETGKKLVLWGAGDLGELAFVALKQLGIKVNFFCDNNSEKHDTQYLDTPVISPTKLKSYDKETLIFISCNYLNVIENQLTNLGFKNIYNCFKILSMADFSNFSQVKYLHPLKIERRIEYYKSLCFKETYSKTGVLNIKSIDIQITERCSLKCTNCSNLMQYYQKPANSDLEMLFKNIDRFMNCVDDVYEFRVLGGDPFMNKDIHKVIHKLKEYEKVKKIIIYTNAKVIPKNENLECLKHEKVILDVTNYGEASSKHDELLKVFDENNIAYSTALTTKWQDCGRILPYQNRTEEENKQKFSNCCNSDLVSLLHGKLYRCPFSANGTNLKAFPYDKSDIVDLNDEKLTNDEIKKQIKKLVYNKEFLTACSYCNGRDYDVPVIKAAEQSSKPIPYKVQTE